MKFKFFKNKEKLKNTNKNPFTEEQIHDRRIEKFNYCTTCNNKLDVINIKNIKKNNESLVEVPCSRCNSKYLFRNWSLEENIRTDEIIAREG